MNFNIFQGSQELFLVDPLAPSSSRLLSRHSTSELFPRVSAGARDLLLNDVQDVESEFIKCHH